MDAQYTPPSDLARIQRIGLVVGTIALVSLVAGAYLEPYPGQFFQSYLIGFLFWTGIATGSLAFLMLQHLTGGAWGLVIRRVLEAATRTLPLLAVLFVPVVVSLFAGKYKLYLWSDPASVAAISDPAKRALVEHKFYYLNTPFFITRGVAYFVIWIGLSYSLNKWSLEQDRNPSRALQLRDKMQTLSGPGLVLFCLTVTFAAFDWVMSLDPMWVSTIFGLIFVAAWALSALAFVIAAMALLINRPPLEGVVEPRQFHDLGKLLLAMVMLWAYFSFSQYLIIWSGNLPEEARWYIYRSEGGWGVVAVAILVLHFALPFLLLLSRDLKRNARTLALVASAVLVMRVIDAFWLVEPVFHRSHLHVSPLDILAPIAIGGLWISFFVAQLRKRPLLPVNDPQFEEFSEHAAHALQT